MSTPQIPTWNRLRVDGPLGRYAYACCLNEDQFAALRTYATLTDADLRELHAAICCGVTPQGNGGQLPVPPPAVPATGIPLCVDLAISFLCSSTGRALLKALRDGYQGVASFPGVSAAEVSASTAVKVAVDAFLLACQTDPASLKRSASALCDATRALVAQIQGRNTVAGQLILSAISPLASLFVNCC